MNTQEKVKAIWNASDAFADVLAGAFAFGEGTEDIMRELRRQAEAHGNPWERVVVDLVQRVLEFWDELE